MCKQKLLYIICDELFKICVYVYVHYTICRNMYSHKICSRHDKAEILLNIAKVGVKHQ
jgi:hypothetical protein